MVRAQPWLQHQWCNYWTLWSVYGLVCQSLRETASKSALRKEYSLFNNRLTGYGIPLKIPSLFPKRAYAIRSSQIRSNLSVSKAEVRRRRNGAKRLVKNTYFTFETKVNQNTNSCYYIRCVEHKIKRFDVIGNNRSLDATKFLLISSRNCENKLPSHSIFKSARMLRNWTFQEITLQRLYCQWWKKKKKRKKKRLQPRIFRRCWSHLGDIRNWFVFSDKQVEYCIIPYASFDATVSHSF